VDRPPVLLEDPAGGLHLFLSSHRGAGDGTFQHLSLGEAGWTAPVLMDFGATSVFHGIVQSGSEQRLAAAFTAGPLDGGGAADRESGTGLTTYLVEGRWLCPGE
jgi:hypothetical protein